MKPEFPFLRTLLDDKLALGLLTNSTDLAVADQLAHDFSLFAKFSGAARGPAMIAMLLYAEQLAEDLAKHLEYDMGPQPG